MTAAHADESGRELDLTAIGHVGRPAGLKGFCHVVSLGATLERLKSGDTIFVGENPGRARSAVVAEKKSTPKGTLVRLKEVEDRDGAERLRNSFLYVETSQLPSLHPDQFYHFELEGMSVFVDSCENPYGTVRAVHNYPTVDALEIERDDGSQVLVPLRPEVVTAIDKHKRTVLLDSSQLDEIL